MQIATPAGETAAEVNDTADGPSVVIPQIADFDRPPVMQQSLFDRRIAARAALKAGALGVFIGMIPVLGIVLTGSLAVYFYRREKGLAPPTAVGARIGGAAGSSSLQLTLSSRF